MFNIRAVLWLNGEQDVRGESHLSSSHLVHAAVRRSGGLPPALSSVFPGVESCF